MWVNCLLQLGKTFEAFSSRGGGLKEFFVPGGLTTIYHWTGLGKGRRVERKGEWMVDRGRPAFCL
jgi:hypothetical protein